MRSKKSLEDITKILGIWKIFHRKIEGIPSIYTYSYKIKKVYKELERVPRKYEE